MEVKTTTTASTATMQLKSLKYLILNYAKNVKGR
jgi:hypothetical protein